MIRRLECAELIAPAGIWRRCGRLCFCADAVYLGIPEFSLRVRINEFTSAQIKKAIAEARSLKKKFM